MEYASWSSKMDEQTSMRCDLDSLLDQAVTMENPTGSRPGDYFVPSSLGCCYLLSAQSDILFHLRLRMSVVAYGKCITQEDNDNQPCSRNWHWECWAIAKRPMVPGWALGFEMVAATVQE